jgi:16S rRNA (adenine1518-N6/adenine1519-N6)-dimethyltransferase
MIVCSLGEELRQLGVRPSRKLGQHFLSSPEIAEWIVDRAGITLGEKVLEIGPGLGVLTERLVKKTKALTVVELDRRLVAHLEKKFGIDVVIGDALKIPLPDFDKVVSNLPYQISSAITLRLLEKSFKKGVCMYQKEFAEHLVAEPGTAKYSRLSVMVHCRAECEIVRHVSKKQFRPVPKVDSAIVEIIPRKPDYIIDSETTFMRLVEVLFSHKNRKVRNGLMSEHEKLGMGKEEARALAEKLPYQDERPIKLRPAELAELSNALHELLKK